MTSRRNIDVTLMVSAIIHNTKRPVLIPSDLLYKIIYLNYGKLVNTKTKIDAQPKINPATDAPGYIHCENAEAINTIKLLSHLHTI